MSFIQIKPTEEYLKENGIEPYFKVWSSVHEGWIYREIATDNQVSTGVHTTKEALLEHGKIEVWD